RRSITGVVGQLVGEALRRFDPETFADREAQRLDGRGVFLERPGPAGAGVTMRVAMVLDTPDAAILDATLDDLATVHAALGDESPLQVPRAKAVGTLTNPQLAMDLLAGDLTTHASSKSAGSKVPKGVRGRAAVVYLHLDACDVSAMLEDGLDGGGRIEKLGPATLDLLGEWLTRPGGIARDGITLRPVLETTRTDGVDGRMPPEWMRDLVVLRDRTCVFPDCTRDARTADLDHIEPYVPVDQGGPPGQTNPALPRHLLEPAES
ncbi:MAG: hypothetical protein Q8Q02_11145, partial [Nocardioides sp.]|nr:hypothetical protein [Nocardioides sp.]